MSQLDKATDVKVALAIEGSQGDVAGIFVEPIDPRSAGWDAPIGCLLMNPVDGSHYRKYDTPTTAWRKVGINLLQLNAGRSNNTTNTYLNNASGVPTDQEGYILPYDARLVALAATTRTVQTWDGEIHLLLTPVAGAVINVVAASAQTYILPSPIDFNANDELQFFGRGSSIDRPTLYAYLEILA
jgi:hypothetical protein